MSRLILLTIALFFLLGCNDRPNPVQPDPCLQNPESCNTSSAVIPSSSSTVVVNPVTGNALLPAIGNPAYAQNFYEIWKSIYVSHQEVEQPSGALAAAVGTSRVIWDTRSMTVSEGIGYGMLNAFFQGDYDLVNRLWMYSVAFRSPGYHLMPWKVNYFTRAEDRTSATDADLDIATSLILMFAVSGNDAYRVAALEIINDIWSYEILASTLMIRPSDSGFRDQYNCSYFAPVAFRLFAWIDPNHNWMGVLNAGYTYLQNVQNNGNGLFPNWSGPNFLPVKPDNDPNGAQPYTRYALESIRIPWRLAWDYHWFGEPKAKAILDRMATYVTTATGGDPNNVQSVYPFEVNRDTTAALWSIGNKKRVGMLGSTCAMGVANAQFANYTASCTALLNSTEILTEATYFNYFNHILQIMYAQFLNGLYIKPASIPF